MFKVMYLSATIHSKKPLLEKVGMIICQKNAILIGQMTYLIDMLRDKFIGTM